MAIDRVEMWCPYCRKGTPVLIKDLSANVIYCQHCGDAPVLMHPTIVRIRQEALEQRLKAELGDRYLTREQATARFKEMPGKRRPPVTNMPR
jgi:hypothetical protein